MGPLALEFLLYIFHDFLLIILLLLLHLLYFLVALLEEIPDFSIPSLVELHYLLVELIIYFLLLVLLRFEQELELLVGFLNL